jgi:5S rRNA maturation endonuclease (ribonuclease M5)
MAKSMNVSEKKHLVAMLFYLCLKHTELEEKLRTLKQSQAYQTVSCIEDWDIYFAELKQKLEVELDSARSASRADKKRNHGK